MSNFKSLIPAFILLFMTGCMSLDCHTEETPMVYPGVRADYQCIVYLPGKDPFWPCYTAYSAIDLPFSFVVDTIYLPFDIYEVSKPPRKTEQHPSETDHVTNQVETNKLWKRTVSPKESEQWDSLP